MDITALICAVIKHFNLPSRKLLFIYVSTRMYTKIDIVIIRYHSMILSMNSEHLLRYLVITFTPSKFRIIKQEILDNYLFRDI